MREFDSFSVSYEGFDSEILGGPVFRLRMLASEVPVAEDLQEMLEDAKDERACLVVARVPARSPHRDVLSIAGFVKVEELVVYERGLADPVHEYNEAVQEGRLGDAGACIRLAGSAFSFDRYHSDRLISDALADSIKEAWVRNAFAGRTDRLFVARSGGEVKGFVSCLRSSDTQVVVDLIAVDVAARGQGIGQSLLKTAISEYTNPHGVIRAGTQANNVGSRRLYESNCFSIVERRETFHAHPNGSLS